MATTEKKLTVKEQEFVRRVTRSRGETFAFVRLGMMIEVDGDLGTIVAFNDSANFDVVFANQIKHGKTPQNCHPTWRTRYFGAAGNVLASFLPEDRGVEAAPPAPAELPLEARVAAAIRLLDSVRVRCSKTPLRPATAYVVDRLGNRESRALWMAERVSAGGLAEAIEAGDVAVRTTTEDGR